MGRDFFDAAPGRLLIYGGLLVVVAGVGAVLSWADALVLALVVAVVRAGWRKGLALASVLLFAAAFPPWNWPTWLFCFTPLLVLWRGTEGRSLSRDLAEAVTIGFAMCWMTTGFVRDAVAARGVLLQGSGCLLFGLQLLLFPIALRRLGGRSVLVTAAAMTAVATLGEWLQASSMNGINWSMTAICLPAAVTLLAQWAALVTPLGVSALLFGVNFLWLPDRAQVGWRRWSGPLLAVLLLAGAWGGGSRIAAAVTVRPLAFSALLAQPHQRGGDGLWRPWLVLDRLTRDSLKEDGPADLIVWPETSLNESWHPQATDQPSEPVTESERSLLTLQDFQRLYQPTYGAACLVGVPLVKRVMIEKYGLPVPEARRVNGACLVDAGGAVACHEKLVLVPVREGLPAWLDTPWVRAKLLPYYKLEATLQPGKTFRLLTFSAQDGRTVRIAASVCYESHLPWLPQFRPTNGADAVVHLTYDGDFNGHPGWTDRQLLACRYRAIGSRTWNLVCSTWAGSAIIDPRGRIVRRLPSAAGVLRAGEQGPGG